ncbi:ABC transporter permease [Streptococcus pneumoniae]|nr:ABC transporter permease [Streptococcus pneumoniae]
MESLIQTYLPNVYKMGWAGQAGWGTAIYLTLYMTVLSFIIGGFLGLVAGLFFVLQRQVVSWRIKSYSGF